jgi:hypothetical protein
MPFAQTPCGREPESAAAFALGTVGGGRYTASGPEARGVHETDSFISEVSEAVRRDRVAATFRRYRWLIAGAVLLIVGGAAFNEWHKARTAAAAAAAGDAMRAALAETDAKARAAKLGEFAAATPEAATLARLAEAGSLAKDDPQAAGAILAEIAGDGGAPELYRSLAALEQVMVLGRAMPASERTATIEMLAADGAPFRPLALEQRALVHLEDGDKAAAVADLQAALEDPGATEALRARARQLIIAAGGELPAATLPGDATADAVPADG